jgi:hypothetical protein
MVACPIRPVPADDAALRLAMPTLLSRLDLSTLKGVTGVLHISGAVRSTLETMDFPWQDQQLRASQGTLRILAPLELAQYERALKINQQDGIVAILAPRGWVDTLSALMPPHRAAFQVSVCDALPHLLWVFLFHDSFAQARFTRPCLA